MLLGSDDNDNKLFGNTNPDNSEKKDPDVQPQGLFNSSYNNDNKEEAASEDDVVSSPFMVSFKANDPVNSVSEKLKENSSEEAEPEFTGLNNLKPLDNIDDIKDLDDLDRLYGTPSVPVSAPVVPDGVAT